MRLCLTRSGTFLLEITRIRLFFTPIHFIVEFKFKNYFSVKKSRVIIFINFKFIH